MNQLFKDKLVLVMLVLGLLTIVTAAGVFSMKKDNGESPYLDLQENGSDYNYISAETQENIGLAGDSNVSQMMGETKEILSEEEKAQNVSGKENQWKAGNENTAEEKQAVFGGDAGAEEAGQMEAQAVTLNFAETGSLGWPIQGDVIQMYSMDTTVYFPTLEQYKCSPGMVLRGEVSTPVLAPANAMVLEVGSNEEIGNYISLSLGGEYSVLCGQLKEIQVAEGQYLEKGQVLGYVAEPTKYYSIEGSNVYLELCKDGEPVDPLDYLE